MIFMGILPNEDRTFTIAQIDKSRKITSISNFWKEGLLWLLDHANANIISVNISNWYTVNQTKNAYEIINKLIEIFDYKIPEKITHWEKVVIKTDTDLFFQQLVRKDLLPIKTREGIEQRVYNIPKAGVIISQEMLSSDRENLRKEITAIATAFSAYCLHHNQFKTEKRGDDTLHIPVYRFIPKKERSNP